MAARDRPQVKCSGPESKTRRRPTKVQQRAEKMEQILDAAEYLFSKHGLYGVTLKDVAKRVGAHHTLLNYYFVDKKKLFDAVFARRAVVTSTRRMEALDALRRGDQRQAHGRRRAARLPRHRPRSLHPGRRELEELRRARRAGGQHAASGAPSSWTRNSIRWCCGSSSC